MEIKFEPKIEQALQTALDICMKRNHEYVTPEHVLLALTGNSIMKEAIAEMGGSHTELEKELSSELDKMEKMPTDKKDIRMSVQMEEMLRFATDSVAHSGTSEIRLAHLINGLFMLPESVPGYLLARQIGGNSMIPEFISTLIDIDTEHIFGNIEETFSGGEMPGDSSWKDLVTCMNSKAGEHNPLVGREEELEHTIRVLCRRDKNNPLHVGEPGVGKTAIVWGLARLIEEGKVPERLKGSRIYMLDMGTMIAGAQFRGDMEGRLKKVLDGIRREGNNIVYIDDIHTIVGAGRMGDGSLDATDIMKPYLEDGSLRFIGSTTYDEYKRHFERDKGMVRRFQKIDIPEPSEEQTVKILKKLKPAYESFHGVRFAQGAIEFAVTASVRHISDRFLPDKAIDLIDEAGAAQQVKGRKKATVDKEMIAGVLAKICKVESIATHDDDNERLAALDTKLKELIYGQDDAIRLVTEAVQMSKAGLTDDNKPLASLLFVGPTGVGKTEVARVLARQLGIDLVRFDMSEYVEKHTVAKLIGSPAGYIGYEDGGLLTDAIRKSPNCVLLFDEIEKAHPDIYNILLQVMDYARLTDSKGQKADFRNVILIMTSNAGAQYAAQESIGFGGRVSRGEAMRKQVKKTFKPEFINRLSSIVTFNDMDREMAALILNKKLNELNLKLKAKMVALTVGDDAFEYILHKGFTKEYGAREIDRIINSELKPLLMREILFGRLRKGGNATVCKHDGRLSLASDSTSKAPMP